MNVREDVMNFEGETGGGLMKVLMGTVLAAAFGGIVHWLRHPKGGHTILAFLIAVTTSAFVGMQTHFLMLHLNASEALQFAVAGACGYSAGTLLDSIGPLLVRYAYKRLGLEYRNPKRRREDFTEDANARAGK